MEQKTLDSVLLEELQKSLEEVLAKVKELFERIVKLEADAGVSEAGFHIIANALELNGFLVGGEPVKISDSKPKSPSQKEPVAAVKEENFTILEWDPLQGAKIGPYDVAYKASNLEDKWASAFNILRQSNSTIRGRYYGQDYIYSYWLYGENKIYRQKLKTKVEGRA
jgi:hypothetical protein